jgi:hypothetical protein
MLLSYIKFLLNHFFSVITNELRHLHRIHSKLGVTKFIEILLFKKIFFLANNQRDQWANSTGRETEDDGELLTDQSDADFEEMLNTKNREKHTDD